MDCIIGVDADGKVLEFNPAAEETFGFKKSDIFGKSMAELIITDHFRSQHVTAMNHTKKYDDTKNLSNRMQDTAIRADD